MFNRTIIVPGQTRTEYVTREVHEHRAPTDASVNLLREMEQKARDAVVDAIHVGDTSFECIIHSMRHHEDGSTEMVAIFSMNGKKMTVRHRDQEHRSDKLAMVEALRDKMAKEIATAILLPALQNFR